MGEMPETFRSVLPIPLEVKEVQYLGAELFEFLQEDLQVSLVVGREGTGAIDYPVSKSCEGYLPRLACVRPPGMHVPVAAFNEALWGTIHARHEVFNGGRDIAVCTAGQEVPHLAGQLPSCESVSAHFRVLPLHRPIEPHPNDDVQPVLRLIERFRKTSQERMTEEVGLVPLTSLDRHRWLLSLIEDCICEMDVAACEKDTER